jgi:hypothetical protein
MIFAATEGTALDVFSRQIGHVRRLVDEMIGPLVVLPRNDKTGSLDGILYLPAV